MTEVAEEFEKQLIVNTPVNDIGETLLSEDTAISGFKGASEGYISKDIGFGKATGWRAHYPNDGTIYQQGQDFKEKTINQMTPRAKEIYAEKIKEGLGCECPRNLILFGIHILTSFHFLILFFFIQKYIVKT